MEQANERIRLAVKSGSTILDLSDLGLHNSPKIPDNIEILNLSDNNISDLPLLPSKLTDLYIDNNQITDVGTLPENLVLLSCVDNEISSFSELPSTLEVLDCRNNYFKTEPEIPKNCKLFILPSKYHEKIVENVVIHKPAPVKENTKKNKPVPDEENDDEGENLVKKASTAKPAETEPVVPVAPKPTSAYPELEVPEGTENILTYNDVKDGTHLVDFEGESKHQRYYLKSTYDSLMKKDKRNPFTKNPIKNAKNYTAKIKKGGKRTSLKNRRGK